MSETKQGLKTTDIKGKAYVEVNERIKYFRENFKGWQLTTEIVSLENGVIIMKALCIDENGVLMSTGHAYEKEGSTFINKTSYIENCETSAVGRALGNLGIGIDTSVASAEEVKNAIKQQKAPKQPDKLDKSPQDTTHAKITEVQKDKITTAIQNGKLDLNGILNYYKVGSVDKLNHFQAQQIIEKKSL
jgi:hypothetical protein